MADKQDGGRWALAGYLYQIVGMLSIPAHVSNLALKSRDSGTDDVDVLIDLDVSGSDDALIEAQHEQFGEDALFRKGDKGVLVQFKHSSIHPPRKIDRTELKGIITKLDDHAKRAQEQGEDITACVLVTDRALTSERGAAECLWKDEQTKKRKHKLRGFFNRSLSDGIETLKKFASQYGATEEEATRGVHDLVGQVLTQTCEQTFSASTFKQDLVEAFTGSREAHPLTAKSAAEISCLQLRRFGENIRIDQWRGGPVVRTVLEDVLRNARQHSLVGIYGPGGCGKSVVVWQLLGELRNQGRCFFAVKFVRNVRDSWVTDQVHKWRNLSIGRHPDDDLDRSIGRLVRADPDTQRPIIWLALDGLDEEMRSPDQRGQVQRILHRFWDMDDEAATSGP